MRLLWQIFTERIPAPGSHDWGGYSHVDATCTEQGYDRRTCNRCGATETQNSVPALGHSYTTDSHLCTRCNVDAGAISYIDSDGTEQSCTDYTFIVGSGDVQLGTPQQTAWYVIYGNVSLTSLELNDQYVNLILMDGATLTISNDSKFGLKAPSYGTLNIYPQTGGSGRLTVNSAEYGLYALSGINIYGGIINITDTSLYGLHSYGNVNIAGGTVNVTGNYRGIDSSNNSIILSWTRSSDRIYTNSYSAVGSIMLTKGFIDEDGVFHSGTISDAATLAGKTLAPAVVLAENADNSTAITAANGLALPIQLSDRTLYKDGDWNTLCLPFSVPTLVGTQLAGATVMELDTETAYSGHKTGFDDGTLYLNFKEVTSIKAGKPYIVKWTDGQDIESPSFTGMTIEATAPASLTSEDGKVSFVGSYSPVNIAGEDRSILFLGTSTDSQGTHSTLFYPNAAMTINSCRAYFQLNKGLTAGDPTAVKEFKLNFGEEDSADGIWPPSISPEGERTEASPRGGLVGAGWFDLSGRKLGGKPTKSGLYIHNGKKVAIK